MRRHYSVDGPEPGTVWQYGWERSFNTFEARLYGKGTHVAEPLVWHGAEWGQVRSVAELEQRMGCQLPESRRAELVRDQERDQARISDPEFRERVAPELGLPPHVLARVRAGGMYLTEREGDHVQAAAERLAERNAAKPGRVADRSADRGADRGAER